MFGGVPEGVPILLDDANTVVEIPDTTLPTLLSATVDYNDHLRKIVMYADETLQVSHTEAGVGLGYFWAVNHTDERLAAPWNVSLEGATVETNVADCSLGKCSTVITMTVTEPQRVNMLAISGTYAGDPGGAAYEDSGAAASSRLSARSQCGTFSSR